jgi:ATP-dependent exoDNAse (exonuclease V) alpha subunit
VLLRYVADAEAKLVLVGDHRQLPAIQAGGALLGLARRLEAVRLEENRRQSRAWERAALDDLQEGGAAEALRAYAVHDRLTIGEDAGAVREALVRDWWKGAHEMTP